MDVAIEPYPLPTYQPAPSAGPLGFMQALRGNLLDAFDPRAYRDLRVSQRRLGRRFIMLSDPDDINHVMNLHLDRYRPNVLAERLLEPLAGRDGLILLDGEDWTKLHKQLVPAFQPRQVDKLIPPIHETAAQHVADWSGDRTLLGDFRTLAIRVFARSMLSIYDDAGTAQLAEFAIMAENDGALIRWQDYVALLLWRGIGQPRGRMANGERFRAWVRQLIDQRPPIDNADQARDLLDMMRAARGPDGTPLSKDSIVDQCGSALAAGFATTAISLYWTTILLAAFPDYQEAVRSELCRGPLASPPDPAMLRSCHFATAFLYESLRLYPPVYIMVREALQDDRIGDFHIPRGASVAISQWLVHRHTALWDAPDRFEPYRFIQNDKISLPRAWMPFGTGPRGCIAAVFATTEILVILRCLLSRYRLSLLGPVPSPIGRVTLLPDDDPPFRLTAI